MPALARTLKKQVLSLFIIVRKDTSNVPACKNLHAQFFGNRD